VVITPAPTNPTPLTTLAATRAGSKRPVNPNWLQIVKTAAPMDTKLMVRTPAECLANDRSFPKAAPMRAAYNRRRHSFSSTAADILENTVVGGREATAVAVTAVAVEDITASMTGVDAKAALGRKSSIPSAMDRATTKIRPRLLNES
jgi:hypothetical protein